MNKNRSKDWKTKNRKGNSKPKFREVDKERNNFQDEFADREFNKGLRSKTNDVAWYAHDENLLRDAASLPFSEARGLPLALSLPTISNAPVSDNYFMPSGLLTFYTAPSIGLARDKTAAVNIMTQQLFAAVRKGKSGYTNYDPNDLGLYVIAMAQVYSYINFLMRVYGFATLYTQRNRYVPRVILEEQNVDIENITSNLANFRYGINVLINKTASFAVPSAISYFKRQAFLYQNVYCEGSSIKDNLYMYSPYSFWQYQEGTSESAAGSLVTKLFHTSNTTYYTYQQLLTFGEELLAPLLGSQDIATINGDILAAFGVNGILQLTSLQEDYPITPIFDETVLLQFKNATLKPAFSANFAGGPTISPFAPGVTQVVGINNSYLQSVPGYQGVATPGDAWLGLLMAGSNILSLPYASPTAGDVMEATRIMTPWSFSIDGPLENTDQNQVQILAMPASEMVISAQFATLNVSSSGVVGSVIHSALVSNIVLNSSVPSQLVPNLKRLGYAGQFKYCPCIKVWTFDSSNELQTPSLVAHHFDLDNFTTVMPTTLQRINEAALLNLFAVPQIAKV